MFYCFSLLMLIFVACTKENPEPSPKNIAGVYRITALTAKADGGSQVNVYDQLNECQKNDTWNFQENGTLLYGGVVTSNCESDDFSGTWSVSNESFTINAPQSTTTYHLEKFDGNALVLSTTGTLNGDPARYFVTYSKN